MFIVQSENIYPVNVDFEYGRLGNRNAVYVILVK